VTWTARSLHKGLAGLGACRIVEQFDTLFFPAIRSE
jgi:hypothetical protein